MDLQSSTNVLAIKELEYIINNSQQYTLEVIYLKGLIFTQLGDIESAGNQYMQVLYHDPLHSNARINLAEHHFSDCIFAILITKLSRFLLGRLIY